MPLLYAGVATISWIDPATGLPEVDAGGSPGRFITRATITAESGYRFSHFLEVWVTVDSAAGMITGAGFSPFSGMYRGPSFLGTASAPVGNIGRKRVLTRKSATFRQIVGCRTRAPEIVGGVLGMQNALGAPMRGPLAMYIGSQMGQGLAESFKVFPPIWTELELTINVDGSFHHKLLRHSYFPSVSYYVQEAVPPGADLLLGMADIKNIYELKGSYDGVPYLNTWYDKGWGPVGATMPGAQKTLGNPWNMTIPLPFGGGLLNAGPQGY